MIQVQYPLAAAAGWDWWPQKSLEERILCGEKDSVQHVLIIMPGQ